MPICPQCQNFFLTPGRCPRDKKTLLDDAEAKKRGITARIAERYLIQGLLGEGGMGSVYLAMHETLQRKVAIKILRREGQPEEQATARFKREAKAASLISHRHVVSILDFGELLDGSAYYVMEHLEGKSLAEAIEKEAPFALDRLLPIAVQIGKGLKAAHEKGVTHRDLKPDNVMLVEHQGMPDFVKLLDFGVAKLAGDPQKITQTGMVLGTPDYMAPEQAIGKPTDLRADVYAFGILLFEMATGLLPFQGQTFMDVLSQHIYHPPPLLQERFPELKLPQALDDVIQKALKKKPENRYQSMGEMVEALLAIPAGGALEKTLDLSQALPAIGRRPAPVEAPRRASPAPIEPPTGKATPVGVARRPAPSPEDSSEDQLTSALIPSLPDELYNKAETDTGLRTINNDEARTLGGDDTMERTIEGVRRKVQELSAAQDPGEEEGTKVYIPTAPSVPAMAKATLPEDGPKAPPARPAPIDRNSLPTTMSPLVEKASPAQAPKAPPQKAAPSAPAKAKSADPLPVGVLAVAAALASFVLVAALLFLMFRGT